MKRTFIMIMAATAALNLMADWEGNGYYRVKNHASERYAYLLDDNASIDYGSTNVDVSAIELWKGQEKAISDLSTVLYITNVEGINYDIKAQGSSVYGMIGEYLHLRKHNGYYRAYGSYSGVTRYLGDPDPYNSEQSYMSCGNISNEYLLWELLPINDTDNFLGIQSTVTAEGKHYASIFCDFPIAAGEGMTLYYVSQIDSRRGLAVYEEVTGNKITNAVPCFIECVSDKPAENKVKIGESASAPSNNLLKGVYFESDRYGHVSYTANDKETMRYLGVTSDGKLGFVTSDDYKAPRNASYLTVPKGSAEEYTLVTKEEYAEICATEILPESITLNSTSISLEENSTFQLIATVNPDNSTYTTVTWTSNDPSIATVDETGLVTAVGTGAFTITATCFDLSVTCEGNVLAGIEDAFVEGLKVSGNLIHNPNGIYYEVYNIQGMNVYRGTESTQLKRGMYILKTKSSTQKVIVQ